MASVRVVSGRRRRSFNSFAAALESIRPWVAFGEAIRIFDNFFGP